MRWITFDQETYSSLRAARPIENIFEFPARTALQYALESENNVVAVLPAPGNESAIATFRKQRVALPVAAPASTRAMGRRADGDGIFQGGGILGLRDEPIFLVEEEAREKRNWWRRFWDY